jgi:hypothetical protein
MLKEGYLLLSFGLHGDVSDFSGVFVPEGANKFQLYFTFTFSSVRARFHYVEEGKRG